MMIAVVLLILFYQDSEASVIVTTGNVINANVDKTHTIIFCPGEEAALSCPDGQVSASTALGPNPSIDQT